jgi:hypothetical protein
MRLHNKIKFVAGKVKIVISNVLHNGLWLAANTYSAHKYKAALKAPQKAQNKILKNFLKKNSETMYGKKYDYASIKNIKDFQNNVPIVTYDDLEPWIEKIKKGQRNVLTKEPVRFFEKTSGSTSGAKYIPYTDSLIGEFQRAISAWIYDLMLSRPKLILGSQYWSISPSGEKSPPVECGIPVGIDNDAIYLGLMAKIALRGVIAVPLKVSGISSINEWRTETLKYLTSRSDLRFISVWNPSFLTLLVEELSDSVDFHEFWPKLQMISCWNSGAARLSIAELTHKFPNIEIQGKGLLATEGVVSIPHSRASAPTIAVNSHFYEFIDNSDTPYVLEELEIGKRYRVVITTGGGFARYDLGDEIEVIAPMSIEFVGRSSTSDICGEKLSEAFVNNVLISNNFVDGFTMLVPEWTTPPRYILVTDRNNSRDAALMVENGLRTSFHYDHCRKLGQLGPIEALYIPNASSKYIEACILEGQQLGDIKPTALKSTFGWREKMVTQ